MQIVVNHLTRMRAGFICLAGIDLESGDHVRPVLPPGGRLGADLLADRGGPIDLARVIDLGQTLAFPQPPEVEDHLFDPRTATMVDDWGHDLFWECLDKVAHPTLHDIFGPDLRPRGVDRAAVDFRRGRASLGCLTPRSAGGPRVVERPDGAPQVRLRVDDGRLQLDLSVTDLRLFGPDLATPDRSAIERVAADLAAGTPVILSVGLTRPFSVTGDTAARHWLQVNNIHRRSEPAWRLGG